MDREKAVDKILHDLGYGEDLREYVSREVARMTGYATELDSITVRTIMVSIRRELNK